MDSVVTIIKREGRRPAEPFNHDKLHASVLAACLSVRSPEGLAETTTHAVCRAVIAWLENKSAVTSADLRLIASKHLERFHPEAAYLYKHHQLVI